MIKDIAHKDAAVFMWCTSSNIVTAAEVMEAWGFTFKASAAWDKVKLGMGQIFRNQHEVLLYGDRGNVPKPIYVPPSVIRIPRRGHSEKPIEVRKMIEEMYPDFGESERIELFARGNIRGWTTRLRG